MVLYKVYELPGHRRAVGIKVEVFGDEAGGSRTEMSVHKVWGDVSGAERETVLARAEREVLHSVLKEQATGRCRPGARLPSARLARPDVGPLGYRLGGRLFS